MFKNPFKPEELKTATVPPISISPQSLEIDLVVFDNECPVVIAGVQITNIKDGWKNCKISMLADGLLISVPDQQPVYVHRSKTRQIYFKIL